MSANTSRSNANTLWSLYQKCYGPSGEFLEKAECITCSKHFAYKGKDYVGSLWRHQRNSHGIEREYSDSQPVKKKDKRTVVPPPKIEILMTPAKTRKPKSQPVKKTVRRTVMPAPTAEIFTSPAGTIESANASVYRYFTIYKGGKAKCRVCMSAGLATPLLTSTVKDMLSHLKTHPRAYKLYELEENYGKSGPEFDERIHLPEKTTTSGIFVQASNGMYYCQFCQTTMCEIKEMQKHLKEKHAINEHDIGNDIIYTEVVFVGDKHKNAVTKQTYSDNPVKVSNALKKNFENQDVDAFGQYVTTLLKSMPKEDSTKLQQTILNKIIEAKLKSKESSKNQNEVESEETIIAVGAKDDGNDYTDTGDAIEEVVMIEEHLEPIYEDVESTEEYVYEMPVHKRFKYENDNILG